MFAKTFDYEKADRYLNEFNGAAKSSRSLAGVTPTEVCIGHRHLICLWYGVWHEHTCLYIENNLLWSLLTAVVIG